MILYQDGLFILQTKNTTYLFRNLDTGHISHLYYGKNLCFDTSVNTSLVDALTSKMNYLPGNTIQYDDRFPNRCLEWTTLEFSTLGKGDIREPSAIFVYVDGSRTSDFLYSSHTIQQGQLDRTDLPGAYGTEEEVQTLVVTLKEAHREVYLELIYQVFFEADVITRKVRVINKEEQGITIEKIMSLQIDFDHKNFEMTTFTGSWANEMNKQVVPLKGAAMSISSQCGTSSNRTNPFFMLSEPNTSEDFGKCYGFNLVYSGNHYASVSPGSNGGIRVMSGINPTEFNWYLESGEVFDTPEAVFSYSDSGFNILSQRFHHFIQKHIVRGTWQNKQRPVLINSWEAHYFKFNEKKLLSLAKKAKEIGIELFVLDDGWFGERDDDTSSLGDWYVNEKKLPNGIEGLAKKIAEFGMTFGIWVEPEMVNENSKCYREHPQWAVKIPDRDHSKGRNQMLLDLTQREVQDYLIKQMANIFLKKGVSYVKWDMNRNFSDAYSTTLPPDRQGEFLHRYTLGLYRVLRELTATFPDILFESCASGGNRFDLGMLCYMPQVWTSDNTDAISRLSIQEGASYGYPLSVMGAHVSVCPNHQTLRNVPLLTRFNTACFGLLGFELNLSDMSKEALDEMREQIQCYKEWRQVFQFGRFYRVNNPTISSGTSWMVVSDDGLRAVGGIFQILFNEQSARMKFIGKGLLPNAIYHFYNMPFKIPVKVFGDLINMYSPVHIKQDSMLHNIVSKFYSLNGEVEDYVIPGDVINEAGIWLKQGFQGTGYDQDIRVFNDFSSRLYFMEVKSE
jgi:alpha-galactosidase